MPLTKFQLEVAKLLSKNRSEDSHLAGGAALHSHAKSLRYSADLDYFHDSEARVASAFLEDKKLLESHSYKCSVEMNHPAYIRCVVTKDLESTKIEWAHDTAWRFMPVGKIEGIGFVLHPIDLAINKLLALVGRDEARDFLDVLHAHKTILSLGALCWAACGKDPGLTPHSMLELLKRRGKYRDEDFARLHLTVKVNLVELKKDWLAAVESAEKFFSKAPVEQLGNLYFSKSKGVFVEPDFSLPSSKDIQIHSGCPGGVLPILK